MAYLRIKDMMKKFKVLRSTIYRWVEDGILPAPIKMGHTPLWVEEELDIAISTMQSSV